MLTFLWTIAWLIAGIPGLGFWNAWTIALVVVAAVDVFGDHSAATR